MHILVYSTRPYDEHYLQAANKKTSYHLHFTDTALGKDTAVMAQDFEAVCCFVNDDLSNEVLQILVQGKTKLVLLRCTGFNNVDLEAAEKLGITVMRVMKYSPHAVAEFAVGLILTLNRKFHKSYNRVREENFLLDGLLGFDMFRRTVGIIGTGRIGMVAGRILAQGFGCHVLTYDVNENPAVQEFGGKHVSLEQLLRESDIVSLHVPLTPKTHHMINAETLAIMKPGAMLINTSRGALIDTKALLKSVESRHTGAVGLDVYEEEEHIFYKNLSEQIIADETFRLLLTFPNVIVTGHQAYFTREALSQIAETTIQNITDFINAVSNKNILSAGTVIKSA